MRDFYSFCKRILYLNLQFLFCFLSFRYMRIIQANKQLRQVDSYISLLIFLLGHIKHQMKQFKILQNRHAQFTALESFTILQSYLMSQAIQEEEVVVTGNLLNITFFEEKMMKNFLVISNKLKKLEGLFEYQKKQKALEKQFKFLSMKVDTNLEKLPKDAGTVSKNDVKSIAKDMLFDVLNSNDERLAKSKFHHDFVEQIQKIKESINNHSLVANKDQTHTGRKQGSKASFTAGQALKGTQRQKNKVPKQHLPIQTLKEVLDDKQMKIVTEIYDNKQDKNQKSGAILQLNQKFDQLSKVVEEMRLGRGYASYLQREAEKFQKFQQFQQKSRQTAKKSKDKPFHLEGIKVENVKGQILKNGLLNEVQKVQLYKQQIAKHQLMQKKTIYNSLPKQGKLVQSKDYRDLKDLKEGGKEKDHYISSLKDYSLKDNKQSQGFKRSHSIRKLDKIDKRLKIDDMKELNGVLRQIELRIESKVAYDVFMGFMKDFQEKLEAIRLSKELNPEVHQLRKGFYLLQSKMQSIVAFLQSDSQEDDATLVKKQWTCISCDKNLDKYQGKVGQHLNWDTISSKKISPTKFGAFGQTGQLAAKIRNLMQGQQDEQ